MPDKNAGLKLIGRIWDAHALTFNEDSDRKRYRSGRKIPMWEELDAEHQEAFIIILGALDRHLRPLVAAIDYIADDADVQEAKKN